MNRLSRMSERAKRGLILMLAVSMILCGDISLYAAPSVSGDQAYAAQTPDSSEPEEGISANEEKLSREAEVSGNTSTEKEEESGEPGREAPEDSVSENVTEEETENTVSEEQVPEKSGDGLAEEIVVGSEVSGNAVSENKAREAVDDLPKNQNELQVDSAGTKAAIDKNGRIVVTWKAAKKAKQYRVDRQNSDGTWVTVRQPASSKKFIDSGIRLDGQTTETYLYRIVPYGKDTWGVEGFGRPGYALCAPLILGAQARTVSDNDMDYYIGVDYTTIKGAKEYEIQRAYQKNRDYGPPVVVSNLNGMGKAPYSGTVVSSYNGRSVLTESYLDGTDTLLNYKDIYYYKIRACAEVEGEMVYSAYSKAVKARVTVRAPKVYMAESVSYNSATIYWEDMQKIGQEDSYYIYKSTKPYTGFKKAKAVKRWQLESISANIPGAASGQTVNCLAYTLKGLKSEIPYYFKVVAVKDKLAGAYSETASATPVLTDVTGLSVNSANYNKIQISFNAVPGATKYYIYEAGGLTVDENGNAGPPSEWRFVNKPVTCTKKAKNGVVTYTRTGLTQGVYYGYYVLPVRGKVHNTPPEQREYDYDYTRMAKPKVTAAAQNLYSIKVSWNQVSGATGYQVEYSTDEDFAVTAVDRRSRMFSKYSPDSANKKAFTNRTFTLSDLVPGVKYYFRVTAYKFTKAEYARSEYGQPGTPSDVVCEWGRPQAVKNLKAEFDTSRPREGATLTWTKSPEKDVRYYKVVRSIYEYDTAKEKVGKLESEKVVLVDSFDKYTKTSYKDTERVENGKYIKYEVCGYYAPAGATSDQWIEGKYASAVYMNPSAIKVASKVKVGVGKTVKPTVTFTPKASTNKALQWTIISPKGSSYITVDNTTGQIKGLKKTASGAPVEVEVTSRNDSNVRAVFEVTVTEEQVTKGNLVVCLDPGHGGSDSGASYGSLLEKRINLETSQYTKERLEQYGVKVYMTRNSDVYVGLEARTQFAKDNGCNLFVSQHMNSGGGSGTEVYYSLTSYGRRDLAAKISSKVSSSLGIPNRGAKTRRGENGDYYSVIRTSAAKGIPGMIVEGAFLDGNSNVAGNSRAIGYATADAILEYYGYK